MGFLAQVEKLSLQYEWRIRELEIELEKERKLSAELIALLVRGEGVREQLIVEYMMLFVAKGLTKDDAH